MPSDFLKKSYVLRIKQVLDNLNPPISIQNLGESGHTAQMAAKAMGVEVAHICKSLVIKSDEEFVLCLVSGDKKLSFDKIKKIKKSLSVQMANANEVKAVTGISIGGVCPVGLKQKLECMIDEDFKNYEKVFCAAGVAELIFPIGPSLLQNLTGGTFQDITTDMK